VARIDRLTRQAITPEQATQVRQRLQVALEGAQALLVSDYGGGLLSAALVAQARHEAHERGLLTCADAQAGLEKYAGFDVVKCNADDARTYLGRGLSDDSQFAQAALELCQRLALRRGMVITRGADGASVAYADGKTCHCPAPRIQDVYDTVGAGDTVIAVLSLALVAGAPLEQATLLANAASSIVIQHVGNYAPSPAELTDMLS
jgi:rfaE bifunctional protein kinase chain/domain